MTVKTKYPGGLRTEALHIASQQMIITDAPVDNRGKGEAFSPTDLLAASLGSCMLTIIGISGMEHGFSIDGTEVQITKIMENSPRRVGEVIVELFFPPNQYTAKHKELIRRSAETCPVALSLHPDLKQTVRLNFR